MPAVLAVTWLCSLGTSIGWHGIFFVTTERFAFSRAENLVLEIPMGLAYAIVALAAGALLERGWHRRRRSTRSALVSLHLASVLLCSLPVVVQTRLAVWIFAIGYVGILSALLWPIVEAYLGAGRRGAELRRAVGRFNVEWA